MPAFCAAIGSFQAKSPTTYFVMVLMMVRVLPLFLTVILICSVTLFGVDLGRALVQRPEVFVDADVRLVARIESFGVTVALAWFCTGSVGLTAANRTDTAAGRGIGRGSDKAALPIPVSATFHRADCLLGFVSQRIWRAQRCDWHGWRGGPRHRRRVGQSGAAARYIGNGDTVLARCGCLGASTCSARGVADVARLTSIGAPVRSTPGEPRPASPAAAQPARATVPHNAANAASRRGFFTPHSLSSFSAKQWRI